MFTLKQRFGQLRGLKLAYVGDGNNVAHSLLLCCSRLGISCAVATPQGYEPKPAIVDDAKRFANESGAEIAITNDPFRAVKSAHAVYTDVWASMGQEPETEQRKQLFAAYQVNDALLAKARGGGNFHALPAGQTRHGSHGRGHRITAVGSVRPSRKPAARAKGAAFDAAAVMTTAKKVALAYSGGLDTSIIIPWLKEHYDCEVVAVCGDIGQGGEELDGLREKALKTGASEVYVEDMREEFVNEYLWKLVRSGAVYEHKYLLGTSIARPLLAKRQAEIALKTGCDALAHGCTGKGNDQVRFELTYKAIAPHLKVIAPWREWDIVSREDAIEYAKAHNVPISQSTTKIYSRDRNIWHISHEGGELEDPANPAPDHIWMLTNSPADAPPRPVDITVGFEEGRSGFLRSATSSAVWRCSKVSTESAASMRLDASI